MFSPTELVFGYTLRSPLKILKEKLLEVNAFPRRTFWTTIASSVRDTTINVHLQEKHSLTLKSMKRHYDRSAVSCCFVVDDQVLELLPVVGSTLSAKFSGPYEVHDKLSDMDYVVVTPEPRRKSRVCHINILKPYCS